MPFYRFLIQGEGIRTEGDNIGFFTNRSAAADRMEDAAGRVLAVLLEEWTSGESAVLSPGIPPRLTIIRSWELSAPSKPGGGHTFYDADTHAVDAALEIETEVAEPTR